MPQLLQLRPGPTSSINHCVLLLGLKRASEYVSMLGNHSWLRQDSSVTSNRTQLQPPWVNKEFHKNIQRVPKKSRTIMQGGLRNQEPEQPQDCDPNLCMVLLACLPFSPCSRVFSVSNLLEVRWPPIALMSYSRALSHRDCIWVSTSNFWGRDAETLWLGQATTLGPTSHNQKRSGSIWKSYLVAHTCGMGSSRRAGGRAPSLIRQPRDVFHCCYPSVGSGLCHNYSPGFGPFWLLCT